MSRTETTDVLIAGGGPVGLAAAIELGRRGVRCTLLEQNAGVLPLPKMNFVNARSMEQCRRWGIAEIVRRAGWDPDYPLDAAYVTSLAGWELARLEMPCHADRVLPDYTPEGSQRCPQIWFDPILADHAASLPGVTLRYRTRLLEFEDDGARVHAAIEDLRSGERYDVDAAWLIGADGAASGVRAALGIELEQVGPTPRQVAIALHTNHFFDFHDKRPAAFFFVVDEGGIRGVVTPTDGENLWRFNWNLRPGESLDDFDADAAVRQLAGADFRYELVTVMPWTIRFTLAKQYRKGRVLLAGDAARTLSPTGGLGMNTGIGDAVDLGWKLAARLQGWGGERLVDSYDAERRPTGRRINEESFRNLARLGTLPRLPAIDEPSQEGARTRAQIGEFIVEGEFRSEFENEGANLGYRYDDSPIVAYEAGEPPPYDPNHYVQTSWPGCRAPHAWLFQGRSTLDLFGAGFTLLRLGRGAPSGEPLETAARAAGLPLATVAIQVPAIADLYERRLVLVRPDGHVAWRGDAPPDDPRTLLDTVRGA